MLFQAHISTHAFQELYNMRLFYCIPHAIERRADCRAGEAFSGLLIKPLLLDFGYCASPTPLGRHEMNSQQVPRIEHIAFVVMLIKVRILRPPPSLRITFISERRFRKLLPKRQSNCPGISQMGIAWL